MKRQAKQGKRFTTKVLLWELLGVADIFMRPSATRAFQGVSNSATQRSIDRTIDRLEREAFLERQPGGKRDRLYRLTRKGKLAALGGLDPVSEWEREWDGKWRIFCFDMPADRARDRSALWRFLRDRRFGCLQGSVWVSPDSAEEVRRQLKGDRHPSSLVILEGHPCAGEKDEELVKSAWDLDAIRERWEQFRDRIAGGEKRLKRGEFTRASFRAWCAQTRECWEEVLKVDPLLPAPLLPRGYPGRKIWQFREEAFRRVLQRLEETPLEEDAEGA